MLTPPRHQHHNRSSPKFAQVITSDKGFPFRAYATLRTIVCSAIFWGGGSTTYSQDATTDVDAKYIKRRASAQGYAF